MQIARGVEMQEIAAVIMGKPDIIYPTLLWDDAMAILVDTGFPGQLPLIRKALEKARIPFARLTHVILTHQDLDHIGSLPALLQSASGSIEVMASAEEKPYIQGELQLVKISPETITRALAALPPEIPEERRQAFRAVLENPPHAHVDRVLTDGEKLSFCGGLTVIITPGHTPGHLCLYHEPSRTLVAGDALRVQDGQLLGPDPRATLAPNEATRSLQKLERYDIETIICYHGGVYKDNANARIVELAASATN